MQPQAVVSLRYPVRPNPEAWVIPEGPVAESTAHDAAVLRIYSLLAAWAARAASGARVARNLAIRWLEQHPRTGIDPDVCVLSPGPADFDDLSSLCLWQAGRNPPRLAVEVVSASHPYKDYSAIQERYAAMGAEELLVFDPLLVGPRSLGGPVALQLWRRDQTGAFERVHFGNEPVHCQLLDAWFSAEGRLLQIADDREGRVRWPTQVEAAQQEAGRAQQEAERAKREAERAQHEAERAQHEAERAQREAERERLARQDIERRLVELEGQLAKR